MTAIEPIRPVHPTSRRHRRPLWAVLAALVLVAVGIGTFLAVSGTGRAAPTTAATHAALRGGSAAPQPAPAPVPVPDAPPLGVYAGPGAAAAAEAVDQQLGGTVSYALDFLPHGSWAAMTNVAWLQSAWTGSPFDLIVGVPMLPDSGATMAQGALGDYDDEFSQLAENLVGAGFGRATLMIGWQPDDSGTAWAVKTPAQARQYVEYWDAIQTSMASAPGADFDFEWDAGDSGASSVSPALMYPGDAAVGMVATDAFDIVPSSVTAADQWSAVNGRRWGPAWMASFAATHHKPLALGMWGLVPKSASGGGDSAAFVTDLVRWAASVHASMCVLWDYNAWAITDGTFPGADARLAQVAAGTAGSQGPASAA